MLDPTIHELAQTILTEKQLQVFELWHRPTSQRDIALHLGISRSAVVDRYDAACLRLHRQGVRFTPAGHPYLEETATA